MTKELIKESDNEPIKKIGKVPNKKSIEEMLDEIDKEREEEFIEDLKEAFRFNNKSTTNWYDKNTFNKILTTIDSNNFSHENKTGKFKFNNINNLMNNIKSNTISKADTKKIINELNKIKEVEIKSKRLINSQKTLLSLFDDLKTIFNNNDNSNKILNEDSNKTVNDDNNKIVDKDNTINDNDNDNDDDNDDYDDNYDSDNDDENTVKVINNNFKKINETKSFEDHIDILKKYHG